MDAVMVEEKAGGRHNDVEELGSALDRAITLRSRAMDKRLLFQRLADDRFTL
jgi:hypothetical protein